MVLFIESLPKLPLPPAKTIKDPHVFANHPITRTTESTQQRRETRPDQQSSSMVGVCECVAAQPEKGGNLSPIWLNSLSGDGIRPITATFTHNAEKLNSIIWLLVSRFPHTLFLSPLNDTQNYTSSESITTLYRVHVTWWRSAACIQAKLHVLGVCALEPEERFWHGIHTITLQMPASPLCIMQGERRVLGVGSR